MVILATEIGDRTFFIAAIMAMRHSRFIIWSGAVGALVVMTVLSTLVGHVAPLLIPRRYTQYAAAGLFLFFGIKMLREGLSVTHAGASEELEEVDNSQWITGGRSESKQNISENTKTYPSCLQRL